ncbi:MAG: uncharacterized protein K0S27_1516 [Gammaproteobacteria bacterium]|jgi:predicted DNA binding CopG/RHH family protein|nr:uncharacterized protein [Gammaproteobacteria bacterium]
MKNIHRKSNKEAWDNRELGASEEHVRKASPEREKTLDERLGLRTISIRLQKSLIDTLKSLAQEDGVGYQPYIRQVLTRHAKKASSEKRENFQHERHLPVKR